MAFLINCPNCGVRDVYEFRFGGEITSRPENSTDRNDWSDYYYFKKNVAGEQSEWWYHAMGCRNWLIAKRNTVNNAVISTSVYGDSEILHEK